MNQKKCKAIRRFVRSLGHVKAKLPSPRTDVIGWTDPVSGRVVRYDLPMTASYPRASFQRIYRTGKRTLRGVRVAVIRARAELNLAAKA